MFEEFEGLILEEHDLFRLVCNEAQENYAQFDEAMVHYFELSPIKNPLSRVDRILKFTPYAGKEYFYSQKYDPRVSS